MPSHFRATIATTNSCRELLMRASDADIENLNRHRAPQ
jgi:hypothetical protein